MTREPSEHGHNRENHPLGQVEEEAIHLPGPTYWPFLVAVGLGVMFLGLVWFEPVAVAGALLTFLSIVGWIWPDPKEHAA